jgi:phage replication O-like protein O
MASPQLEHGYTRIANEILEALARTALTGCERRVLDLIFRESYGRGKKYAELSFSEMADRVKMNRSNLIRTVNRLRRASVIQDLVLKGVTSDTSHKNRFIFQKDYHRWGVSVVTPGVSGDTTSSVSGDTSPYILRKEKERRPPLASLATPKNEGDTNGVKNTGIMSPSPDFMNPISHSLSEVPNLVHAFLHKSQNINQRRPRTTLTLAEPTRNVLLCFKVTQNFDLKDEDWNRVYFKKLADDADDLLDVFAGDWKLAAKCCADIAGEFRGKGLKFTLKTIVNHAAEWRYKHAITSSPAKP